MFNFDRLAIPGIHEERLTDLFGADLCYRRDEPVFDAPLVCLAFSNRCGSNLLAGYLRDTPCFSGFHEQLNFNTVQNTCEANNLTTLPDYIRYLCAPHVQTKTIYGFKTSWDQLAMLYRCRINEMFTSTTVIHMTREDIIGQAISLMIANQTKQWTSTQDPQKDTKVVYCQSLLQSLVQDGLDSEQLVKMLCDIASLPRTKVTYESLVSDPAGTLVKIANAVNADLGNWVPREPKIRKQATAENNAFRAQFVAKANMTLR